MTDERHFEMKIDGDQVKEIKHDENLGDKIYQMIKTIDEMSFDQVIQPVNYAEFRGFLSFFYEYLSEESNDLCSKCNNNFVKCTCSCECKTCKGVKNIQEK